LKLLPAIPWWRPSLCWRQRMKSNTKHSELRVPKNRFLIWLARRYAGIPD